MEGQGGHRGPGWGTPGETAARGKRAGLACGSEHSPCGPVAWAQLPAVRLRSSGGCGRRASPGCPRGAAGGPTPAPGTARTPFCRLAPAPRPCGLRVAAPQAPLCTEELPLDQGPLLPPPRGGRVLVRRLSRLPPPGPTRGDLHAPRPHELPAQVLVTGWGAFRGPLWATRAGVAAGDTVGAFGKGFAGERAVRPRGGGSQKPTRSRGS